MFFLVNMENNELERYGSLNSWSAELGLSPQTLRKRLEGIEGISAKAANGRIKTNAYFAESEVRERCADLLNHQKASEDGIIEHECERYATPQRWAKELGISHPAIEARLKDIEGRTFRASGGQLSSSFFPESIVRERCNDLLQLPKADTDGFLYLEGKKYATPTRWSRVLRISQAPISQRLEGVTGISARDAGGQAQPNAFFPEEVVLERCKDLLVDLPQADENACIEIDGERYAARWRWSRLLGLSQRAVEARLSGVTGITAKNRSGVVLTGAFIAESIVREKCADLLTEVAEANDAGFFELHGKRYGTRAAWAREFKISTPVIHKRFKGLSGITGKDSMGHVLEGGFFAEEDARAACAILLRTDIPMADKSGFLLAEYNGRQERFATFKGWARELGMSNAVIAKRLRGVEGITGKLSDGQVREKGFYSESAIFDACKGILGQGDK